MLKLTLFDSYSKLTHFDFLSDKDKTISIEVIAPSPSLADEARVSLIDSTASINFQVLTISNFLSSFFKLYEQRSGISLKRKSELLMILGAAWNRVGDQHIKDDYELFRKTFNLFTDLRSITFNDMVIKEAIALLDPIFEKPLFYFNSVLEELKIADEHRAYHLLSQELSMPDSEIRPISLHQNEQKGYVLWGFTSLTSNQILFLQELSRICPVYVLVPAKVYEHSFGTDWVQWLNPDEVIDLSDSTESGSFDISRITQVGKGKVPLFCNSRPAKLADVQNVYLGAGTIDGEEFMSFPLNGETYKSSISLFKSKANLLLERMIENKSESLSELEVFFQNEFEHSKQINDFRTMKSLSELFKLLLQLHEYGTLSFPVRSFNYRLLKESLELNMPRTYYMRTNDNHPVVIDSIKNYQATDKQTLLLIGEGFCSLGGGSTQYTENVEKILAPVGPIRRPELDKRFLIERVKNCLQESNVHVVIENEILERYPEWAEILGDLELETYSVKGLGSTKKVGFKREFTANPDKKISATYLQTYKDCPQKFYYKYVDASFSFPELSEKLMPNQLGDLEHALIKAYLDKHSEFDPSQLSKLAAQRLNYFIEKHSITLSMKDYEQALVELITYSGNGIQMIFSLTDNSGNYELKLEEKVDKQGYTGSIDCYLKMDDKVFLFDFKRSDSSIPSNKKIIAFDKIQLWFYQEHWPESVVGIGYINLANPEGSVVIYDKDELPEDYFSHGAWVKARKVDLDGFDTIQNQYQEEEKRIITAIQSDKVFPDSPLDSSACMYCSIALICEKGASNGS